MRQVNPSLVFAVVAAISILPTAEGWAATPAEAAPYIRPARIEPVPGSDIRRITLTDRAAQRLDVQTAEVRQGPSGEWIVPYASIIYDLSGVPWIYTSPEPRSFVRHRVTVLRIDGANAYLSDGPAAGTRVVTVGVSQLYGAEKGVGH